MYILIVNRGYPSEKYKMNGIFEFDQAEALAKYGHKVIYATIDMRSIRRTRHWGFESLKKNGVQIEAINIPFGRMPRCLLNKLRIFAFTILYKKIERIYGKPDIIHAHFLDYGYISIPVAKKNKIPLVLTEHLSLMNQDRIDNNLMKLGMFTYPEINKLITVSTSLAESISTKFGVETVVIPNIVDTKSFKYKDLLKKKDTFDFISIGNLIYRKGFDILIEAFSLAFKGNNKVRLYIYGEGPEHSKIERMISDYKLKDKIFLMGSADRKEIAVKMCESDCFVLASRLETFGVVYIEAMAMGLPIIATRCGGPEDFVTRENGVLIPINNVYELTEALKEVFTNIALYNRKVISDRATSEFGSYAIAERLTSVYKEILECDSKGSCYD